MRRRPVDLYEALLDAVAGADEQARVRELRRHLRVDGDLPPAVASVLADAGVGRDYLLRHVLSLHRFAPDVREALRRGLPLAVARLVNGLQDPAARARALVHLGDIDGEGDRRLLPRGVARAVERAARHERTRAVATDHRVPPELEDGWVQSDPYGAPPAAAAGDVWTFPRLGRAVRGAEPLHPLVVEHLLAIVLPTGGRLVDVTAGAGTIAAIARRHRVATWSGDLDPGAPFVHRADARTLLDGGHPGIGRDAADALVVHPPTYAAWRATAADADLGGRAAYLDDVGAMIAGSLPVVRPGGAVVVVTRPVREHGSVSLVTSHLAEVLEDTGLALERYVVAVASGGGEDWHLLVGRRGVVERG